MVLLSNVVDNNTFYYGMFVGAVLHLGLYFLTTSYLNDKVMTETGVQTEAWEEDSLSDTASIETISPVSYAFENTSAVTPATSEVETQTIAEVVPNPDTVETQTIAEVVPNPDTVGRVIDYSNAEYIAAKVDQLNALDPFMATPWTAEKVTEMIDILTSINGFM
jgi:hypothetical protein